MTLDQIGALQHRLRVFARARDWEQFHTPKNLTMALSGEVGELTSLFQWLTAEESEGVLGTNDLAGRVVDEVADVAIYLLRLADVLDIDLGSVIKNKIDRNEARYPAEAVRGRADIAPQPPTTATDQDRPVSAALQQAVLRLGLFLTSPLTKRIADLEFALAGLSAADIPATIEAASIDVRLLQSALTARGEFGRLNDLVHAAAICLLLPHILEEGETITVRPSLAAGNDPSRPFDLETDRRIAEFKFSGWKGADGMRKKQTFKDLVNLAADESGRRAELYVVGQQPIHFLRTSKSTAAWALDRSPAVARLFVERFGPLETPVADFTGSAGSRVHLADVTEFVPDLTDLW
jgi:NTP pyrophosphatase (non-canonical NTP hydrolase)